MGRRRETAAVAKRVTARKAHQNRLFKALQPTSIRSDSSKTTSKQSDHKPNQLSIRLGEIKPAKRSKPSRSAKPTDATMRLDNRSPVKRNALAKALNVKLPNEKRDSGNNSSRSSNNDREGNNAKPKPRAISIGGRDRPNNNSNKSQNTVNNQNKNSSNDNISFKNASLIPFLRIENLTPDVSESDIRTVLSTKLGPIIRILKMNTGAYGSSSVTAEVFFVNDEKLQDYALQLDKINADGRILRAKVACNSLIINSDKLWDAILKEVRVLKQQFIKNNL